jgi:ribonuclease J
LSAPPGNSATAATILETIVPLTPVADPPTTSRKGPRPKSNPKALADVPDIKLQIVPLGGLGEFGMNCMAICCGEDILVVDCGMMFPDDDLLGVDVVTPDFTFLEERRTQVRGVVLTHAHEDHIGGLPFLLGKLNVPVYGTEFTLAMVERRLSEHELLDGASLRVVRAGAKVRVGCFEVDFIPVTHSTASTSALAITTPLGVLIHTGDFKIDPTPVDNELFGLHAFAEYGKRGVLLLMSDSTNVDRPGFTESERAVRPRLDEIFSSADQRIVISCFSSAIHRIQQILDVSEGHGRKVALIGRSLENATETAHRLGLLTIPDRILLRPEDIQGCAAKRLTAIVSGTQGEPMSALSRVAVDTHRQLTLERGDLVVHSARIIPGREKAIYRMFNHVARRGADIVSGSMNPPVHVSGHASREELSLMLNLVRPRYFVPLHGEYRQLDRHARLAQHLTHHGLESSFILESGDILEIDRDGARRAGKAPVGRICIDSGSVDEIVGDLVIRDRQHLSEDGIVLPIITINSKTGLYERSPEIVSRGFAPALDGEPFLTQAQQVIMETLDRSTAEERTDRGVITEKVRADLRRFLSRQSQRRPLVMPVIIEV